MKFSKVMLPLAATAVAALPTNTSTTSAASPTVTLDYSTIVPAAGNESLGYYKYQNIRFAAPPTGDLRWAAPQWPAKENTTNTGDLAAEDVTCATEEDCLYLDVWAPAGSEGKNLPVLVWTYGGGFTSGSKALQTPEGLFELSKDFIFVGYNYRVGIAGMANGPTFLHEGGTSNTGVWDVEHAFKWTRKYISAFGGDPEQITAAGFSAGASQVLFQLTRFAGHAEQLFDRAYVCSPGFVPGAGHHQAELFWQNVSSLVGCDGGSLECMRQVNFTTVTDAATNITDEYNYQFQPRVDGDFIADTYETQLYQRRFNFSGPLVISHELHEDNSMAASGVNTSADIYPYLRKYFPAITNDVIEEVLALYPSSDYTSEGLRAADIEQALDLTAHNLALTQALHNETWNALVTLGEATHGTDQEYYWYSNYTLNTATGGGSTGAATGETAGLNTTIVDMMQKYLVSFVLTGNPNTKWSEDKLYWPQYGSNASQIVFNDTFYLAPDNLANNKSLYWNKALWY